MLWLDFRSHLCLTCAFILVWFSSWHVKVYCKSFNKTDPKKKGQRVLFLASVLLGPVPAIRLINLCCVCPAEHISRRQPMCSNIHFALIETWKYQWNSKSRPSFWLVIWQKRIYNWVIFFGLKDSAQFHKWIYFLLKKLCFFFTQFYMFPQVERKLRELGMIILTKTFFPPDHKSSTQERKSFRSHWKKNQGFCNQETIQQTYKLAN